MRLKLPALVLLVLIFPAAARAQLADIEFTTTTLNGQVTVTGFSSTGQGPLTIPGTIAGLPVTAIGPDAFQNCSSLTRVEIPDSVTSIGANAFENCANLASVTIPGSVTSVGDDAFEYCTSLTSVTIPGSVATIPTRAFKDCTSLATVMISSGVTTIRSEAFEDCTSLTSVTIPASVTEIGNDAFGGCFSLTSASFEGKAPTMGSHVFAGVANGFSIYSYAPALGLNSPLWKDDSGDTYPATIFPAVASSTGSGDNNGMTEAKGAVATQPATNAPPSIIPADASKENQDAAMTAMSEGLGAWFKKDFDLAMVDFNEAIRLDPKFLLAYCNRSTLYAEKGNFAAAIADSSHAIQIDPHFAAAYYNRGDSYRTAGDFDRAIADLSRAAELMPDKPNIYFDRGLAYLTKGDNDNAIADFSEALHPAPHKQPSAEASADLANFQSAWIDLNPENSNYYRGIAYLRKGDGEKALADFNEALRLDPKNADAYARRGEAYDKMGQYDKAIPDLIQAVRHNPNNVAADNMLASILATCPQAAFRDGKTAVALATRACDLTEWKDSLYIDTLAAASAQAGDFANAVKWENQYLGSSHLDPSAANDAKQRLALYEASENHHDAP